MVGSLIAEIHQPLTVDGAARCLRPLGFRALRLPDDALFARLLIATKRHRHRDFRNA